MGEGWGEGLLMSVASQTIAVFTGSRADYDLLFPLLRWLKSHLVDKTLTLMVGGEHLFRPEATMQTLETDAQREGWRLQSLAGSLGEKFSLAYLPQTIGHLSACELIDWQAVGAFIILGDRVEAFAMALAAFYNQIPILHLAGGDLTQGGCVDDKLRWMITEVATWHACFSPTSENRLLARGINPQAIINSGSLAVDNVLATPLLSRRDLLKSVGWDETDTRPIVLFTQHPVGVERLQSAQYLQQSLDAFKQANVRVIATAPNLDANSVEANEAIQSVILASQHEKNADIVWFSTLGRERYFSWLAVCDAIVGNSSSLLYEAPLFGKPALCIGNRQQGREHAENVHFVDYGVDAVVVGLEVVLHDEAFKHQAKNAISPFGNEPAAPKIGQILMDYLKAS
jgi:GDP/UDP-N,N'-diacetylbacillosamine 2-epimerase (hydrolysing)